MESISIEKNVPVTGRRKATKYPWVHMEVGDSFKVPCGVGEVKKLHVSVSQSARNYSTKNPGFKFTIRSEIDGVRAWRIAE